MAAFPDSLTPLQREVLREFFEREKGFFLTGGAALAGYHLGHRCTDGLDLFTLEPQAFERGSSVVQDVAACTRARLDVRQEAPGFRRYALIRGDEGVVIDLVLERVPQLHPEKVEVDGVLVDPADEILANKLTALAGRMEERDLVDVFHLERLGLSIEQALPIALQKDGGCTPATLAWLLSQIHIPDDARLPGGMSPAVLRQFVNDLVRRLLVAAAPK